MTRPAIVVVLPLRGRSFALLHADTAEDQERIREAIIARADLVGEIVVALGELLEALDEASGEDDAA
jgi:hypothetical protein